jgi:imidazolonepropionase-like amidohydrolase
MDATRFIVAGGLLDGRSAVARKNVYLAVKDGRITAMGRRDELPDEPGAIIDDLSHCTIVPPLMDCSVALSRSPSIDPNTQASVEAADPEQRAALFRRHIGDCLAHGVLAVADNGTPEGLLARSRTPTAQEQAIVICSSAPILLNTADDAPTPALGHQFHRIQYSPDIDQAEVSGPGMSVMNVDALRSLLSQPRREKTVVVANGPQAVAEALAAGCDAIEQGYLMGEENLRKMAADQVLWLPSVLRAKNALDSSGSGGEVCCRFSLRYVAPGKALPGAEVHWKAMLADQLGQLGRARILGTPTAVGTGAGSIGILHGESVVEEIKLFIKAGYSLAAAIGCASEQGARFFGVAQIGALMVGSPATFLLTRGTPHQLPRKLAYLEGVYVNGAPSGSYRKTP